MNKQKKSPGRDGINWTDHTWNPIGGCQHACRWEMPDGSIARCYAEAVAESIARQSGGQFYGNGFEHHYWYPRRLDEPLRVKEPSKIFLDSMSDLMGHWVPDEQIEAVLDVCRKAHWHTFQLLTKNHQRLKRFDFPDNVWVGVSAPPTYMFGKRLSERQQHIMFVNALRTLRDVRARIKWASIEPLSWDVSDHLREFQLEAPTPTLQWVVFGAATNGRTVYQPNPAWLEKAKRVLIRSKTPFLYKNNLVNCPAARPWVENFPE